MVDYALSTLEQYDLEIKNVRKGRGSWVVSCKEGDFVLKEYSGSEEKAALQKALTHQITEQTGVLAQEIVPNREGSLLVKDAEERTYTLQTYMEGRECNLKEEKECESAIITMARMHQGMCLTLDTLQYPVPYSLKREFAKRNAELRRIRRYLKEKKNKNEFERFLYSHFNFFFEKALETEEQWKLYESYLSRDKDTMVFCHGDYQHHNVWMNFKEIMVLQFEKYMPDLPSRDLYLFMRKLLEKCNWDIECGQNVLKIYERERPMPCIERISMIYRLAYPEKFWKIANFYYNSKKSFMPEKNMDKLEKLLEQEKAKEVFIEECAKNLDK